MTDELKPCPNPWCEALEREGDFSPVAHRIPHGNWQVSCTSCDQKGPIRSYEDHAITAWNTRATDTQVSKHSELADRIEALKSKDIEGHLSDAIQDFLRQQFGIVTPTDNCRTMALGAIAALRQAPDERVSKLVEAWEIINKLRAVEGNSIEICHDNPDFGGPNCLVVLRARWSVDGENYYGDTVLDALRAALDGMGEKA
jgi:hypothetical protein